MVFALAAFFQPAQAHSAEDTALAVERAMTEALPNGAALLLDLPSGRLVAAKGNDLLLQPRPAGSLLKMFTVYAALAGGTPADEVYYCGLSSPEVSSTSSCWYKPGHGNMTLKSALANSCNAYFRQWIADKDLAPVRRFYREARLPSLGDKSEIDAMSAIGMTTSVRLRPVEIVAAAAALFDGGIVRSIESTQSGSRAEPIGYLAVNPTALTLLAEALAEAASSGTGSAVGKALGSDRVLVKTGTSLHWIIDADDTGRPDHTSTDGWCLVLYPAEKPSVVLLVLAPGGRGADEAANAAAAILNSYLKNTNK